VRLWYERGVRCERDVYCIAIAMCVRGELEHDRPSVSRFGWGARLHRGCRVYVPMRQRLHLCQRAMRVQFDERLPERYRDVHHGPLPLQWVCLPPVRNGVYRGHDLWLHGRKLLSIGASFCWVQLASDPGTRA
jgi:hypothetical protein